MIIPEACFNFQVPKDLASGLLQIILRSTDTNSVAATSIEADAITVPADRVLVLTAASLSARAGAGQNVSNMQIQILAVDSGEDFNLAVDREAGAAAGAKDLRWVGQVWVPPEATVQGVAQFNAGVVANTLDNFSICGISIPRGNVQQG